MTHLRYIVMHEAQSWAQIPPDQRPNDGLPSLAVSAAHHGGGVAWEFAVEQHRLVGCPRPAIQLRIFDDAFDAFRQIPSFFAALCKDMTLRDVRELLDAFGFVDETERPANAVGP